MAIFHIRSAVFEIGQSFHDRRRIPGTLEYHVSANPGAYSPEPHAFSHPGRAHRRCRSSGPPRTVPPSRDGQWRHKRALFECHVFQLINTGGMNRRIFRKAGVDTRRKPTAIQTVIVPPFPAIQAIAAMRETFQRNQITYPEPGHPFPDLGHFTTHLMPLCNGKIRFPLPEVVV